MRKLPDLKFKGIKLRPDIKTFRLFLAIYPPSAYFAYFRDVLRGLDKEKRNLKQTPVDQIHLTLKFFGSNVSEESKAMLISEIRKYKGTFPRPKIKITHVQFGFSYQDDPRVLMASLEENLGLIELHNFIHSIVKKLGLLDTIRWKEKNSQNFHITIARLKPTITRSTGRNVKELTKKINIEPPKEFIPEGMFFVQSKLTRTGPEYQKLDYIEI